MSLSTAGSRAQRHRNAGASLHREIELLVSSGLSPTDALAAATTNAAAKLGREHDLGAVEVGKVADLVVLDGDPTADVTATQRIHAVVAKGRRVL